jgi:ribonuclease D
MCMIDFQYVGDPVAMKEMLDHLGNSSRISVDLESDSYHHYAEKIALIQICDGSQIFIVDPLSVDLAPLAPLFEDKSKEKIFHDVDYDGRMLLTFLGIRPLPIFDTMIAARILGREKVGLADLVNESFGVTMDKGLQKADWSRRPLSREMLEYASLDVAHLVQLRDYLEKEIEKKGRKSWADEEFSRLVENLEPMPEKMATFTRVKGARFLSPRQLGVLQMLLEWREDKAKSMDLPTFKVIGTERLFKIAETTPRSRRELDRMGILSERQAARFGGEVMKALEKGTKLPESKLPRFQPTVHPKRDFQAERVLRELKSARDRKAEELGLDPGFLLPNAALKAVARLKPNSVQELEDSGLLKGWQMEVMGGSLTALVGKKPKRAT